MINQNDSVEAVEAVLRRESPIFQVGDDSGYGSIPYSVRRALKAGEYVVLRERKEPHDIYLVRFWLSYPARRQPNGRLDSGNSQLLHWLARPDDDDCLHDHPFDFSTRVLSGGYTEEVPAGPWHDRTLGPLHRRTRGVDRLADTKEGETATSYPRAAEQLHRIAVVEPDTWTFVQTGPKRRQWGFHPAGKPWQYYRDYLGFAPDAPAAD